MRATGSRVRAYIDTSVVGGAFDPEFALPTSTFLQQAREGRYGLVVSDVVLEEVHRGPDRVRLLLADLLPSTDLVGVTEEAVGLRDAYIAAGVLAPRWGADGLHVALATLSGCALLVSWNFRHIVHYEKVPMYNAVNRSRGCQGIAICSPPEVLAYGETEA